jgi:hypothetical protein
MQNGCGPGCTTLGAIIVLAILLGVWLRPTFAHQRAGARGGTAVQAARR